jgi:hypothetical protein
MDRRRETEHRRAHPACRGAARRQERDIGDDQQAAVGAFKHGAEGLDGARRSAEQFSTNFEKS